MTLTHQGTRVRVEHERKPHRHPPMSDPNKLWPTGLTAAEAEDLHRHLIQGPQIFGAIAALAHLLAYIYSPWLHWPARSHTMIYG